MAELGHVLVSRLYEHSVEWIDGTTAGVTFHQATRDVPVGISESEHNTAMTLLHRLSATVRTEKMLSIERFSFFVLPRENIFVAFDCFACVA